MSVPKGKRTEASTKFFDKAYKMNDMITRFLIKDFGIKKITRDLKTFTYNAKMSSEDLEVFCNLCAKYHIDVESDFPLWLIDHYRNSILSLLQGFINDITQANTIYPNTEYEFNIRRQYQWSAISKCYQILQTLQTAIRILHPNCEKYMPYVDIINEELDLLKKWKKSGNKILKSIKEKEVNNNQREINKIKLLNDITIPDNVTLEIEKDSNNKKYTINPFIECDCKNNKISVFTECDCPNNKISPFILLQAS